MSEQTIGHYQIVELAFGDKEHRKALKGLLEDNEPIAAMSGQHVALNAIIGSPDARMLVACHRFAPGMPPIYGVLSFRQALSPDYTEEQQTHVQIINLGAPIPKQGVGSALVRKLFEMFPGVLFWTKSAPDARGFWVAMGFEATGTVVGELTVMECEGTK